MQLELSLAPAQFVWALAEPISRQFIKNTRNELGYQDLNLILSQSNPGPVKVDLANYPEWAQKQIHLAIQSGQLVDTSVKIEDVKPQVEITKHSNSESTPVPKPAKKKKK